MAESMKWPDTSAHAFVLRMLRAEHTTYAVVSESGQLDASDRDALLALGFHAPEVRMEHSQLMRPVAGLMVSALVKAFPKTVVRLHDPDKVFLPPSQPSPATEFQHNGTRIYPVRIRRDADQTELRWAVESPENKARRAAGERTIGGDTLVVTPDAARTAADAERKQHEAEVVREREAAAAAALVKQLAVARRAATQGMSLAEIKAHDFLNLMIKDTATGERMTRRVWVQHRVAEGWVPSETMVDKIKPMSRMAHFRATEMQQSEHDRKVKAGGKKVEYWLGDFGISKTEYDFARALVRADAAAPDNAHASPRLGMGA